MHHPLSHNNTEFQQRPTHWQQLCYWLLTLTLLSAPVAAREIEGIKLSDSAEVGGQQLLLNGAGLRSKFFISVYVGGLYLSDKSTDVKQILAMSGPKRVSMHFIYDEISEEKIRAAWSEGFSENNSDEVMQSMAGKIETFNSFWPAIKGGDVALVDYLPGKGTQISLNGKIRGIVVGEKFNQAVLKIWLGDNPVDSDLKSGMLGGE